ncbi:LRR receptor-like serine threonine-protein kinase [Seminavis robusta]|uniref:LRR receptor-like serine threonine-protein kinase n=1 Tax=Seminavis robusta TaxID=568900 RepID=A0A9N8ER78_9STRA|nr:LRR receptor-like serine threonine-protein kinase [Seminavis robusta]|eukprot:Sro1658_g289130.1 LRR receptor-like serine threonine-protein kinase (891) ;mRNA; f:4155-7116
MQSTKHDDAHQAVMMPSDTGTGPDVAEEAEESHPKPPTSHTEVSTSTHRDLDGSTAESLSEEFDVIEKATRISASGGVCEAGEAERRKLLAFEQKARTSKENSIETADPQNMEEGLDPLDLAKIAETRLRDSDASPTDQGRTIALYPTTTQAASPVTGTHGYEEETNISPLDLAKIVEARLQDSGENSATPEVDNSQSAVDNIEQQSHHQEQKVSNSTSTGDANRIGLADTNVIRVDMVQADGNHGILNLPRLERSTANRRPQLQPGAYPSGGNFHATEENQETAVTHIEPAMTQPPTIEPENLAVANLVEDETTAQDLPQAQNYNLENENRNRESRMKHFKTKVLLGVIVLLAIVLILVAIVAPGKKMDNADLFPSTAPSELPSSNPSQGPSSYSEYWLSLFPESTVSAIQEDPVSPQSMAFQWLMEEIDVLHNLTEGRVVQRFVLATFYFANSEERWLFSNNWLNHSVHECLWYSSLEDWFFFSEANIYIPLDHIAPCEQDPAGYLEDGILYQGDGILKHFWLSFNGVVGSGIPPELYLLTELRSLALDELNLTSTIPEELSGLSNLEYLSMLGCGLFGSIPEALGSLSKLGVIHFFYNSLTGTIPSSLFSLTNSMQVITLVGNQLTGPITTELGLLTTLVGLGFEANLFTGTIPTELGRLTGLRYLFLAGLNLKGALPNELAVLTDMELLQLHNSGLTGTLPKWLGNMTSLEGLTLSDNSLTGTIPTELGLLTKLWNFWLGENALSGGIPSEIGKCEQMIYLVLERCGLTATIPTELGLLTELLQLWLFDNDLTGTVPLELGNVPFPAPYGQVLLDRNHLSGVIPESLCSANDLSFDCSSQLCGCDLCNCSDNRTSPILEGETTNEDGQLLNEANQTEANLTEPRMK